MNSKCLALYDKFFRSALILLEIPNTGEQAALALN
jgi:hypothetical protein